MSRKLEDGAAIQREQQQYREQKMRETASLKRDRHVNICGKCVSRKIVDFEE